MTNQEAIRHLQAARLMMLGKADGTRWTKQAIIQEFGFPVLSKEIAAKIELLANPSERNKTVRHAIITGETYGWARVLDYIGVGWQPQETLF